jgi:GNAT superfamily N-acetyltransferase
MPHITIRPAIADEQKTLKALQWRASLSNPGDRKALLAHPVVMELPIQHIEAGDVFVAEVAGIVKGYAAICLRDDGELELDALFVEPDAWRQGIGLALVGHACSLARCRGAKSIYVIGNPHAEGFYLSCGFKLLGTQQMRFGIGLLLQRELP